MWSIGVIAYTILTGTLPFTVTAPREMLKRLNAFRDPKED